MKSVHRVGNIQPFDSDSRNVLESALRPSGAGNQPQDMVIR